MMIKATYAIAGLSFVVGFFAFTWARGCLLRGRRMLEEAGEEVPGGKLDHSRLAGLDPRLAAQYRTGVAVWIASVLVFAGSVLAAIFLK